MLLENFPAASFLHEPHAKDAVITLVISKQQMTGKEIELRDHSITAIKAYGIGFEGKQLFIKSALIRRMI